MKRNNKKVLLTIAGIAFVLLVVQQIITTIVRLAQGTSIDAFVVIRAVLYLAGYAVAAFSCFKFNPKLLLTGLVWILGVATRFVTILGEISRALTTAPDYYEDFLSYFFDTAFANIIVSVPMICAIVFLGLYCFSQLKESAVVQTGSVNETNRNPISENTNDKLERLEKLKALQTTGAITQEEFEEKKKQLLGL